MASFKELINKNVPVLVDFYAEWCGPCKVLHPILEDVKAKLGDKVSIIKIDVDKNPQLASQFQVRGVPTMLVFKQGELKWRQSGVLAADSIAEVIRNNA